MARKPKDYNAQAEALKRQMAELQAKLDAQLAATREANRRQIVRFVEKVGADGMEPEVLMGALLDITERAKDQRQAERWRQAGSAYFQRPAATPRKPREPRVAEPASDAGAPAEGSGDLQHAA